MPASAQIDRFIAGLQDWRGQRVARLRQLVREVDPDVQEEWKWETPVWAHRGNLLAAGVFQDHVKLNFFKGASLPDPQHQFNAGLEAKATRAIDIYEKDALNETAIKDLIRAALAYNTASKK
jgi:hypothetical protein